MHRIPQQRVDSYAIIPFTIRKLFNASLSLPKLKTYFKKPKSFLWELFSKSKLIFASSIFLTGLLILAQTPVYANHTKLLFNMNGRNEAQIIWALVGSTQLVPVKLMAVDVDNVNGLGSFLFTITMDSRIFNIPSNLDGTVNASYVVNGWFLTSTGKQIVCDEGRVKQVSGSTYLYNLSYICVSLGPAVGPQGTGQLVTFNFQPGSQLGTSPINFTVSQLVTGGQNPAFITHTPVTGQFEIVKCANVYGGDTTVNLNDIFQIAAWFAKNNPTYDLNGDNTVNLLDIFIAARQFATYC